MGWATASRPSSVGCVGFSDRALWPRRVGQLRREQLEDEDEAPVLVLGTEAEAEALGASAGSSTYTVWVVFVLRSGARRAPVSRFCRLSPKTHSGMGNSASTGPKRDYCFSIYTWEFLAVLWRQMTPTTAA